VQSSSVDGTIHVWDVVSKIFLFPSSLFCITSFCLQKTLEVLATHKVNSPIFDIVPVQARGSDDLTLVTGFGM
jgi:hypothetical protein